MARTVVNLDDRMVLEAMRLTGLRRKVDVVNEGLRVLVAQQRLRRGFSRLRGRVTWDGDLDHMRHGR
jgi:Arc/MetJ family transcription regulator